MAVSTVKKKLSKAYTLWQLKRYEKVFKTEKCNLKHLFIPNKKSDKLLVVFSGFGNNGEPAKYNYIRTFESLEINRLYILDDFSFDKAGAYYLGKDNDFFIEDAVQRLIHKISSENNFVKEKVITCGSSKGGTAALYFGLKYGYGEILAGAPQTKIADYLIASDRKETLKYIIGEITEDRKATLDKLMFDVVKETKYNPIIKIHVGKGDHHYKNYIIPFSECLDVYGLKYELDIADYSNHGDLGKHFPPFALRNLNK